MVLGRARLQSCRVPHFSRAVCARSGVLPSTTECDNSQVPDSTTPPRSPVLRRSFRKDFPAAVRGEGVYLWDAANTKYLDFSGSAAVNFIGHGVPEISAAMTAQASRLEFVHTSQFTTPVAEAYAEELLAFAGENFRGGAVYFTSGGSESIETALKLARQYQVEIGEPLRHQIVSRKQSYHGSTLGALSVSGNRRRREIYLPMVREFAHVACPTATAAPSTAPTVAATAASNTPPNSTTPSRPQTAKPPPSSSSRSAAPRWEQSFPRRGICNP